MYQLYYYPCNASLAPHFVLAQLEVNYELILVDRKSQEQKSAAYLTLNPAGRIPTLTYGNNALFESSAICWFLAEQHPQAQLIPPLGSPMRAKALQWLTYLTNTLQAELMIYFYPQNHLSDPATFPDLIANQEQRIYDMFVLLDREISAGNFLVGESLGICDFYLLMLAIWADEIAKPPMSLPNLARYLRQLVKQPAIVKVCEVEGISLALYE